MSTSSASRSERNAPLRVQRRRIVATLAALCGAVCAVLAPSPLYGQATLTSPMVVRVEIVGDVRPEASDVAFVAHDLEGKPFSAHALRRTIERLYSTGWFRQVSAYRLRTPAGVVIRLAVAEKLRVRSLAVEGERALKGSQITSVLRLREGGEYDEAILRQDRHRIHALYRQNGFFEVRLVANVTADGTAHDVEFRIEEGPQATTGRVTFDPGLSFSLDQVFTATRFRSGGPYVRRSMDEFARRLRDFYRSRGYIDIHIDPPRITYVADKTRVDVVFHVEEGSRVIVRFVGNRRFDAETLRHALSLDAVNEFAFQMARDDLEAYYRRDGYFKTSVFGPEVRRENGAVVITFSITESSRYTIEEIRFQGNVAVSNDTLANSLRTRPRSRLAAIPLLGAIASDGIFDADVFGEDRRVIEVMYRRAGYWDVRVTGGARVADSRDKLIVGLQIREGTQRIVRERVVEGHDAVPIRAIESRLTLDVGEPLDEEAVTHDRVRVQELYSRRGYPYCRVDYTYDASVGRLTYRIDEGPRVTFGRISVQFANASPKTLPIVIRRELRFSEGDVFDAGKRAASERRLRRMGFISTVDLTTPGFADGSDALDVLVVVRERKAGSANVSGGFNPSEGVRGTLELVQRNWNGSGRRVGTKMRIGTRGSRIEFTFVEPWTAGTPTATAIRAFSDNLEEQDGILTQGGVITFSRDLSIHNRGSLQYRYQVFKATGDLADFGLEDLGVQRDMSAASISFRRDTRDDLFNPSRGWLNEVRIEVAGAALGGNSNFSTATVSSRYYVRIGRRAVLAAHVRLGATAGRREGDSDISSTERFRLGGSTSLRGYPERSLGVEDAFGNFRGDLLVLSSAEFRVSLHRRLGAAAFIDVGNLWNDVDEIADDPLKASVGAGVRVVTPIGPARLDVGVPLIRLRDERRSPRLWLALGHAF